MSVILMAGRKKDPVHKERKKVIRKAGFCLSDTKSKPLLTKAWELRLDDATLRISFSRDNLHVWLNGDPVEVTAYISDKGMDLDLYFDAYDHQGHIFSDVEGNEMTNTLYIDDEIIARHQFAEKK